jgi:hypothetical protein
MTEGDGFPARSFAGARQRFNETARSIFQALSWKKRTAPLLEGRRVQIAFPPPANPFSPLISATAEEESRPRSLADPTTTSNSPIVFGRRPPR